MTIEMGSKQIGRPKWADYLIFAVLSIGGLIFAFPFFYILMNSFKPGREILFNPMSLPTTWTLSGYIKMWEALNIPLLFRNSLILAVSTTVLNLVFDSMAAYGLAKMRFPGRDRIFSLMVGTMMIPGVLFLIPTYVIIHRLGWVNQFQSLIIPGAVSVYNIFLLRQFAMQIQDEIVEAARVDGATEFGIYWQIIIPMMRPALATVGILTFMGSWNDFFGPLLYLNKPELWTLQLGLFQFQTSVPGQNVEQIWAAMAVITVPLLIIFFLLQDQFMAAFANATFK